jgi:transposase, IS30 family
LAQSDQDREPPEKRGNLTVHDEAELDRVAAELNDRPRKRRGFRKPI